MAGSALITSSSNAYLTQQVWSIAVCQCMVHPQLSAIKDQKNSVYWNLRHVLVNAFNAIRVMR